MSLSIAKIYSSKSRTAWSNSIRSIEPAVSLELISSSLFLTSSIWSTDQLRSLSSSIRLSMRVSTSTNPSILGLTTIPVLVLVGSWSTKDATFGASIGAFKIV